MTTNFLGLDLPTVSVTIGPEWATKINQALEVVDEHDHSDGKGAKIPSSGLNINSDLSFNSNSLISLQKAAFSSLSTPLTGATNTNNVHVSLGDLYYTNSSGVAVQITDGGTVAGSGSASFEAFENNLVNSDIVIAPSSSFTFLEVNTEASRNITLPLANSVSSGRFYVVKDISGQSNSNNITLLTSGSDTVDGSSSLALKSNYGSTWVVSNGTDSWYIA